MSVWYRGASAEIVIDCGESAVIKINRDYNDKPENRLEVDSEFLVDKSNLEPLVTDLFRLNDKVKSTSGNYSGIVSGFELLTNRVVTMSDKLNRYKNDRTRYVYKAYEVIKQNDDVTLEPGGFYKINDESIVFVAADPNNKEMRWLFDADGQLLFAHVPKQVKREVARCAFGIKTIVKIS